MLRSSARWAEFRQTGLQERHNVAILSPVARGAGQPEFTSRAVYES